MKEIVLIHLLLLFMTAICWFLVFNEAFRKKVQRPAWRLYKLNPEQKEMHDAMYFAGVLVAAIAFTIFFVVSLVLAFLRSS
jgi:hypothetical protein